jgi:hypothetical protein
VRVDVTSDDTWRVGDERQKMNEDKWNKAGKLEQLCYESLGRLLVTNISSFL